MERKAICKNVGVCSLANKVQVITDDDAELICPECGEELELVKEDTIPTAEDDEKKRKRKRIAAICGGVVVLAGIGAGGYFMMSDKKTPPPPVEHSVKISKIDAGEGWVVKPTELSEVSEKDTIWIVADDNMAKEVADKGATLAITLEDSTSTITPANLVLTKDTVVTVTSEDGKLSKKYIIALKKKAAEQGNPVETGGDGTPIGEPGPVVPPDPQPEPWASYATFDGTTMQFKKAHVIPGTNETAQPGDRVTGVWVDGEVNSVRWFHADGTPSEHLTHK
ncbi:MAG: hypothetical protein Q4E63_01445 [Prevotellaceae bacterium]|nr:hypothetical protein [Prevotellaceae bacterium]